MTKTGGVFWWSKDAPEQFHQEMTQSVAAMKAEGIPFDHVDGAEVMRRYPQFHIDKDIEAVFQDDPPRREDPQADHVYVLVWVAEELQVVEWRK